MPTPNYHFLSISPQLSPPSGGWSAFSSWRTRCEEGSVCRQRGEQEPDNKAFLRQWGLRAAHPSFSVLTLETTKLPPGRCPSWPPAASWTGSSTMWSRINGLSHLQPQLPPRLRLKTSPLGSQQAPPLGQACAESGDSLDQNLLSPKTQISDFRHHLQGRLHIQSQLWYRED